MSLINYDRLIKESLKNVVKRALQHTSEKGLQGQQHFYITFKPDYKDAIVPDYLLDEYPDELTIVLENQFWNLNVLETFFSVSLNFNSKLETIQVPFDAILEFSDPSEDFVLQFELDEDEFSLDNIEEIINAKNDLTESKTNTFKDNKVVSLDLFRKK